MKKQLYIHIGLFKTGTTTLQSLLFQNYDSLLAQGILYPKMLARNNQHAIFASYFTDLPRKCMTHNRKRCQDCWSNFDKAVANPCVKKIVLSSEYFSLFENFEALVNYCRSFDTKIIVYLRRQDQFLQALYNQKIKNPVKQITLSAEEFIRKNEYRGDFKTLLNRWDSFFGQQNILVRIYEKTQLHNSLVDDFMSLIGCDYQNFVIPKHMNPTLPPRYVASIKAINKEKLPPEQHQQLINIIIGAYSSHAKGITVHDLFSPQQCHSIMQRFDEDNNYIAQHYLGREDGRLFTEPLPDITTLWEENPLLTPEELIQEILLPYMTFNGKNPLTSERIINELLIPYIKNQTGSQKVTK